MVSSDPTWASGRYCCIQCTSDLCIDCFLVNRAGAQVSLGTGSGKGNFYCGRRLGKVCHVLSNLPSFFRELIIITTCSLTSRPAFLGLMAAVAPTMALSVPTAMGL